ncbi:MAG: alpha/beta hydrolase [Burkholderiales bacterium]|nr:MAG: alpha/beta hydrolase [Burkholderiales bacterium]
MPHLSTDDDVSLYYAECGAGMPVVFVHEFAGDHRSWESQLRHFGRRYRCIAYNARGYPPSDVPTQAERYSQDRARDDIRAVLDALDIERAHVVGLSMGGFATLHFGFTYPERALSLTIAGCGYGAEPDKREQFAREAEAAATGFETRSMREAALAYALGPTRVQFQNRDPRGWQAFVDQLAEHSSVGSAATLRGVQARRPSLFEIVDRIATIRVPTLVMTGDEDWPCLEPALLLKRTIPTAGLVVMPNCGHAINLEDPAAFNAHLMDFLHAADTGSWPVRDPRAMRAAILGSGGEPSP